MKKEIIIFTIFSVILAVILLLILLFNKKLFKHKQEDKKKSLDSGYGFYSDPITLPCKSSDGKCTSVATQQTIFKCLPHPGSGKGCINDEGSMTYESKVVEEPCQLQCVSTLFDIDNGIERTDYFTNNKKDYFVNGSGCNRIINIDNGLEETNFFLGDYDTNTQSYELKNCIPTKYQGYYQKNYTCNSFDKTGAENCRYTCGQDGIVRLNGLYDEKLSKNVLMYYPTEFNEEGVLRHVCYDINNVNQIEILNSVKDVPENFYYPNICYKHVNNKQIKNLENLKPIGNSNLLTVASTYNTLRDKFFITDIKSIDTIININYDYYYDYQNYIKLQLNNELVLMKKITKDNFTLLDSEKLNYYKNGIIGYIPTADFNQYIRDKSGNHINLQFNTGNLYASNDNGVEKIYSPFILDDILGPEVGPVDIDIGLSTTFSDLNNELQIGDYIFYYGSETGYNTGRLTRINNAGSSSASTNEVSLFKQEKIIWRKLLAATNDDGIIDFYDSINRAVTEIPAIDIAITGNQFLIDGADLTEENREVELIRKTNTMGYYSNSPFLLYAQEKSSNLTGFYYPLYLNKPVLGETYTNQGTNIYAITATYTSEHPPSLDLSDLQNKPFYISTVNNESVIYFYPLYINNANKHTRLYNNDKYTGTNFYYDNDNFKHSTTVPPSYLNYLNFDQYETLAISYNTNTDVGNYYPVFLSQNIKDVHEHEFVDYIEDNNSNIVFYMPNNVINTNHALEDPPERNMKLIDFNEIYHIGSATIYHTSVGELKFINNCFIPNNLAIPNNNDLNNDGILIKGNNILATLNTSYINSKPGFNFTIMRNQDKFLNSILEKDSPIAKKSKLYNQIIATQSKKNNDLGADIIINPEKKIIIQADYTVFRSPNNFNSDGSVNSICYDQYNKPLPEGTVRQLQEGQRITVNVPCSNFNTNLPFRCGKFGSSSGAPIYQQRRDETIRLEPDIITFDLNGNYKNENNFMEQGLCFNSQEQLYCLKDIGQQYNANDKTKCFPPYFTKENEPLKKYAPDEETYLLRYNRDYYLSLVDNNDSKPLNPIYWRRIFNSDPGTEVVSYQTFIYRTILTNIYEIDQSGVTGLNPIDFSVQPVYRKNIIPYFNQSEFEPNSVYFPWKNNYEFARFFLEFVDDYSPYQYNNIGISFGGNNVSTLQDPGADTIVNQNFIFSYQDQTIKDMELKEGDIFQTGFSFFNSFLLYLASSYTTIGDNIIDTVSIGFVVDNYENKNFHGEFINSIGYKKIGNSVKEGDYLVIMPGDSDDFKDPYLYQASIFEFSGKNMINPCFEIILVEKIDRNNSKAIVKRNILNLNMNNYICSKVAKATSINNYAILLNDELLNLNFPITRVEDDKLFFNLSNLKIGYPFFSQTNKFSAQQYLYEWLVFTPYITANYIRKNAVVPSIILSGSTNLKAYLTDKPERNRVVSALLDIVIVDSNNIYVNEFRTKRYTAADDFLTTFSPGDTILLSHGDFTLTLTISVTNRVYKEKKYDYICSTIDILPDSIKNSLSGKYLGEDKSVYMPYVYYNGSTLQLVNITASPSVSLPDNITIVGDGGSESVNLTNISFFPYEDFPSNTVRTAGNNILTYQKQLEEGNDIAYLKLIATSFESKEGNNISVNNIKIIGKPEGIRYLDRADINSNSLNRTGKGCIVSMEHDINNQANNNILNENQEFFSNSGFVLSTTQKDIASYQFITGEISSLNSITNYQNNNIYSINNIIEYENPNQRIYYRNTTGQSGFLNEQTWEGKNDTIYNDDLTIDFVAEENYFKDTNVVYQDKIWLALQNNYNIKPGTSSSVWQEVILTQNNLQSTSQQNFYTFTNENASITNEQLLKYRNENIDNFPLVISDYISQKNYAPEPVFKMSNNSLDFSKSFIKVLPGASALAEAMGKAFLTKNGNNYLTLPAVPYNSENYQSAKFLRDLGDNASSENLSQYIYQIPITNALDEGKPFCTGQYETGVSNVIMANSIIFFMLPLALDNQDYPAFGVSYGGTVIKKNTYSYGNLDNFGMSLITYKNGEPRLVNITSASSTKIIEQTDKNYKPGDDILLTKIGGGSSVNVTVKEIGYQPINDNITNNGNNYKLGDIWYFVNKEEKIIAHGYLQPKNDTSLGSSSFIAHQIDFSEPYNYEASDTYGFKIISENGSGFKYDFSKNGSSIITSFSLEGINFSPGHYSNGDLDIYVAERSTGQPLQEDEYLIGTSTPGDILNDGTSAYQIFNQDRFKCRLYGIFGIDYFSKIGYQLKDKLINNLNEESPGLIFSPFNNDLYSNSSIKEKLVGNDTKIPDNYDSFYDTFTLQSLDGTSANTILRTNNYNKPVIYKDSFPLPQSYNNINQLSGFNIVNTTDLHKFFSVSAGATSNIYMGDIQTAIPVLSDTPTDRTIIFANIRQNRDGKTSNNQYDCNFFFTPSAVDFTYPSASGYIFEFSEGNYYYTIGEGEERKILNNNNTLELRANNNYVFNLNNTTMNNHILAFGLSPGILFPESIITENNTILEDYSLDITYNIGNLNLSFSDYKKFYNLENNNRFVNIVYNTKLNNFQPEPIKIYLGFSENESFESSKGVINIINNN